MITNNVLLNKVNKLLKDDKITSFDTPPITAMLREIGIDDKYISQHYYEFVHIALEYGNKYFLRYLNHKGIIDKHENIIYGALCGSNDLDLYNELKEYPSFKVTSSVIEMAIRICAINLLPAMYEDADVKEIMPYQIQSVKENCMQGFKIVLQAFVDKAPSNLLSRALDGYTMDNIDRVIQMIEKADFSSNLNVNNRLALAILGRYGKANVDVLLTALKKNKDVVSIAMKLNQTPLIPDAMKKIFLIKDKK